MCRYFKCGLKGSYEDIISAVDDFFDQWDPSTATLMEEAGTVSRTMLKNKPHLITFNESILAYELFSQPLCMFVLAVPVKWSEKPIEKL